MLAEANFSLSTCFLINQFFIYMFQIPVFKGATKPLLGDVLPHMLFHGHDGLGDAPDPNAPGLELVQKEGAVPAIIRIINEHPEEVCNGHYIFRSCSHFCSGV